MPRFSVLTSVVAAGLIGLIALRATTGGNAQQATPAASGATGLTMGVLGRVPSEMAPGQALALLRITIGPRGQRWRPH